MTDAEDASGDGGSAGADAAMAPTLHRAGDVAYETVGAADGMAKGVLIGPGETDVGVAMRRFTLEPGATVPRHTNAVGHVQHVLAGEYVVGLETVEPGEGEDSEGEDSEGEDSEGEDSEGEEHIVRAGDSLAIPAGTVHSYRNEGDEPGAFICVVPEGDDTIALVD